MDDPCAEPRPRGQAELEVLGAQLGGRVHEVVVALDPGLGLGGPGGGAAADPGGLPSEHCEPAGLGALLGDEAGGALFEVVAVPALVGPELGRVDLDDSVTDTLEQIAVVGD